MLPTIRLLGWTINSWGLLNLLSIVAFAWAALACADGRPVGRGQVKRVLPWAVWGGAVGAHLYFLLAGTGRPWSEITARQALNIFSGSAIQGGIAGGLAGAAWFCAREKLSLLALLDALAPAGALAQAVSRVGCFLAGCCYGKPTTLPIGVVFRSPESRGPVGVPLHPTQLYEAGLMGVVAAWLWRKRVAGREKAGEVFTAYLAAYGVIRFLLEFLRDDDAGHLIAGLAHSQYTAVAMLLAALALRARLKRLPG